MSTDPTPPTLDDGYQEITAQQWHAAAARAAARDRLLLEEAFAGIDLTDDIRRLFAAVTWHLGRENVLTLAGLPTLLARARATPAAGDAEPELPVAQREAIAAHDEALTAYFVVAPSRHRADAVADAGRRLLDLTEARTGHPATALTLTGTSITGHPIPPEQWPHSQRVSAIWLEPGQLLLGYLDTTTIHAFDAPERIEYAIGRRAVTVHTHTGRTLVLDPYTATYRVFTDASPADADLITCARNIMIAHLDPAVIALCANLGEHDVIDHPTARKIAHAYQWSWATCWFAGEGEIGHTILTGRWQTDPATEMMHAMFGWWQHSDTNPDGAKLQPGEQAVIDAMSRYLTTRAAAGDLGPVPGWDRLPIR